MTHLSLTCHTDRQNIHEFGISSGLTFPQLAGVCKRLGLLHIRAEAAGDGGHEEMAGTKEVLPLAKQTLLRFTESSHL